MNADAAANAEHFEKNRLNWDERAAIHAASTSYDLDWYRSNPGVVGRVVDFDRAYLGDLTGLSVVHLQCHIGTDTLSLARLGAADVTGVDQSGASLDVARQLFADTDTPGRFVESNVYDAPTALADTFDVVYTGVGALNWLPDIDRWSAVVSALLEPGGRLYIREGHPMLWAMDDDLTADGRPQLRYPYFETNDPMVFDFDDTYVDTDEKIAATRTYEWNHSISEIFNAVTRHGMNITLFEEHRTLEWKMFEHMVDVGNGRYELPPEQRDMCPLMYSLGAVKQS